MERGLQPASTSILEQCRKVWSLPIRELKRRERRAPGIQLETRYLVSYGGKIMLGLNRA
jgi:hypothetical protein